MANIMDIMAHQKETENGAYAFDSSMNAIVDLFAVAGALRGRSEDDIIEMWYNAFEENEELAFKMLFYIRNVRGGLGERDTFRILLNHVAKEQPEFVINNIDNIPFYGRYDDLFVLFDTPVESTMVNYVYSQLKADIANMEKEESISLLAKWMPSINTSSTETRALANRFCKSLSMTPVNYRKTLSKLRRYLDVTEVHMSANNWDEIEYQNVPSNAMNKHNSAFDKHDTVRFNKYKEDVKEGKATIHSETLYPYDIVRKVWNNEADDVAELQWKSLPDYFDGATHNAIVMADVSGSMFDNNMRPITTSIGLAIYFAEHNTGEFANKYMTFTDVPQIRTINSRQTLRNKINDVRSNGVGYSTDLELAFNLILDTALSHNLSNEDLPESIIVISDMEINDFGLDTTFLKYMKTKFEDAGYTLPKLVWWNVNARQNTFHAEADNNVQFISGSSTAAFKSLIDGVNLSAIELVINVLQDYDRVIIK